MRTAVPLLFFSPAAAAGEKESAKKKFSPGKSEDPPELSAGSS
jgi:hypothetical protein